MENKLLIGYDSSTCFIFSHMNFLDGLLLGVLQGLTEFLPVSSSGHLVLAESFLELPVQDLLGFDVAVHFGTLLAIFVYFWKDFKDLLVALWKTIVNLKKREALDDLTVKGQKMIVLLIVCTLPAVIVALLFDDLLETTFRGVNAVAVMLLVVAVYFILAEYVKKRVRTSKLTFGKALIIGIVQAFALIPGISRSGSTIATGIIQGIDRQEAARFSFLLGSVAITAATLLSVYKVIGGDLYLPGWDVVLVGVASSFLAGYLAVYVLMAYLKKHSLIVFSAYLVVLSVSLLIFY